MRIALAFLLACMALPSLAAECLQGNAIYKDADDAYRITFSGTSDEGRGLATNRFALRLKGGDVLLEGSVSWNNGIARPNGILTYQCPAGDITGDELDACKIWEGVIYATYPDGAIDLLPPDADPATFGLLLPDLGRKLRYSKPWSAAKLDVVPWDHFTYIGCQK